MLLATIHLNLIGLVGLFTVLASAWAACTAWHLGHRWSRS